MAISHVDTNTATQAAATSVTVTKPTGAAENDLMLAFFTSNSQDATPPSGWTEIVDEVIDVFRCQIFYKVAGDSEPANYAFTVGASAPLVLSMTALRGVELLDVIDIDAETETALTHAEAYTTPALTGGTSGRLLYLRTVRFAGSTPPTFTASSVTELADVGVFSGGSVCYSQGLYLATADYSGGGAKSGLAITCSAAESHNVVMTVGIRATGIPGTMGIDLFPPTMSMDGSPSVPATAEIELPLPEVGISGFFGNTEGSLAAPVPISVSIAAATAASGVVDITLPFGVEFNGESRRFAENVVTVLREERWFVMTQDGFYDGLRTRVATLLDIGLPLIQADFDVFTITLAEGVSVGSTAYDATVLVGPSAGTATTTVTG